MLPMKTTKVKKLRKSKSYRCPRCDARRKPAYTCTECGGRVGKCCISDISLGIVTCIYCEKAVKQGGTLEACSDSLEACRCSVCIG